MSEFVRHLDDDACAALVLGLASAAETEAATAHARTCAACETRLRAHAGAGVRARADLADGAGVRVVGPRRTRSVWPIVAATAAAAAVLAVFLVRTPAPPDRAAPAWLTTPGELVHTRSEVPVDDALRAGLEAYARHDLPAAITALRAAHTSGGSEQARRLYLGHALLASGEATEARAWLESVDLDALPDPWREEARRSLAAAWRRTGRTRQADSIESAAPR
jgi:hypothetical protein